MHFPSIYIYIHIHHHAGEDATVNPLLRRFYLLSPRVSLFMDLTMSTTTTTAISSSPQDSVSLKPYKSLSPSRQSSSSSTMNSTTAPALQSLYRRAANAMLYRNFDLTQSLIQQAFAILRPPDSEKKDGLDDERRRWDILRVTLETTAYQAPLNSTPSATDPTTSNGTSNALPESLRSLLTLTPSSLLSSLHERSVKLFTPTAILNNNTLLAQKPRSAYLPPQIVHVLMMASLRLDCPEFARSVFEDWLEQRRSVGGFNENDASMEGNDGVRGKDSIAEEKEQARAARRVRHRLSTSLYLR